MAEYNPSAMVLVTYKGKLYAGQVESYSRGNDTYDVQITYEGRNIIVTVPASAVQKR